MATITQLNYVVALDRCRHFGRAATLSNVSQPTLSAGLQKLEDELGLALFDRSKQPILPTDDGRPIIEQAKVVLNEFHRLELLASRNVDDVSGEFRLALIPTIAPYLVPLFLEEFTSHYPKVELFIEEQPTDRIIEALDRDQVDAGILATPLGLTRIEEEPLYYEPLYAYAAPGHPLAAKTRVSESALGPDGLWLLSEEHCLRKQVIVVCGSGDQWGSFPTVHLKGGSLETVIELVSKSQGYTLLPLMAADAVKQRGFEGSVIPIRKPTPAREVSLVHRRGPLKKAVMAVLKSTIEANLPDSLPRIQPAAFNLLGLLGQFK